MKVASIFCVPLFFFKYQFSCQFTTATVVNLSYTNTETDELYFLIENKMIFAHYLHQYFFVHPCHPHYFVFETFIVHLQKSRLRSM